MLDKLFPVLFVGHGSPMNIVAKNDFTEMLNRLGKTLSKPDVIVVISAHWLTRGNFISITKQPKTIYDFYGFPDELYQITYPAKGSPETAEKIINLLGSDLVSPMENMGLDHGAWSVLYHLYPKADVPVLQLSVDIEKTAEEQFDLGKKLQPLRNENILLLGSGNIVHSFRGLDFENENAEPLDLAVEFDHFVESAIIKKDFTSLIKYKKMGEAAEFSVPTPDHYFPLLTVLGASVEKDNVTYPYTKILNRTIGMRTLVLDSN